MCIKSLDISIKSVFILCVSLLASTNIFPTSTGVHLAFHMVLSECTVSSDRYVFGDRFVQCNLKFNGGFIIMSFEWTGWCDTDWFGHPFELWMCNFTIIYDQPSEIVNWSFSLRKFFRVPLMFSMPVMWLLFWRRQKLVSRDKIWINICKYFSGFIHGRVFLGRWPLSVGWLLWYKS